MSQGLPRRIKLAFIVQALLGSIVISAGVMLAGLVVRQGVVSDQMQREADMFWTGRIASPAHPLPRSSTMAGYLEPGMPGDRSVPRDLRELQPGIHQRILPQDTGRKLVVLVERRP